MASGFGAEKKSVEYVTPLACGADNEGDEDFAAVEKLASDVVTRDKFTRVVFGAFAGPTKLQSLCICEVLVCGNGRLWTRSTSERRRLRLGGRNSDVESDFVEFAVWGIGDVEVGVGEE